MQVSYTDWKCKNVQVTDIDSPTILYTIDLKMRKPHLVFKSAGDEAVFGTAIFHAFKSKIDIEIHGRTLELKLKGIFSTEYTYVSPAFQNATMTWVSHSGFKTFDYVCLDERLLPVARFTANAWSRNKLGKVELLGSDAGSRAAKEELVVTGLTLAYNMLSAATALAVS